MFDFSWLRKLFGSGKANKITFPEPVSVSTQVGLGAEKAQQIAGILLVNLQMHFSYTLQNQRVIAQLRKALENQENYEWLPQSWSQIYTTKDDLVLLGFRLRWLESGHPYFDIRTAPKDRLALSSWNIRLSSEIYDRWIKGQFR